MGWREERSPKCFSEASEDWGKHQPSPYPLSSVPPSHLLRLYILLGLSFLTNTLRGLHFTSLAKSHYICAFASVIPSLPIWTISLYLSRPHVSASSGCAFLSYSSVWGADSCSSNHSGFPYALLDFLNIRMEGSCALWKVSLKSCQLLSATLSLRTVFQGILPTNSLSGWNSTLPKFRVLALLFARPVFLENPNSAGVWSL